MGNIYTNHLCNIWGTSVIKLLSLSLSVSLCLSLSISLFIFCLYVSLSLCKLETGQIRFQRDGFKHRALWVFWASTSSGGGQTQWVPLSLFFVCQSELTQFFSELTEFAAELSEFSLPKQYSARFLVSLLCGDHPNFQGNTLRESRLKWNPFSWLPTSSESCSKNCS